MINHFKVKPQCVFFCLRHQAGWFPFRPEQQNVREGERGGVAQEEAERHQDIQEMVRDAFTSSEICCLWMHLVFVNSVMRMASLIRKVCGIEMSPNKDMLGAGQETASS